MKNNVVDFLQAIGISWSSAISGVVGGAVLSIYRKDNFWNSVRNIFTGGVVSGYFTPVLQNYYSVNPQFIGFISFVCGIVGMVVIDCIYKYISSNTKKWKEAFKIIFSDKT